MQGLLKRHGPPGCFVAGIYTPSGFRAIPPETPIVVSDGEKVFRMSAGELESLLDSRSAISDPVTRNWLRKKVVPHCDADLVV